MTHHRTILRSLIATACLALATAASGQMYINEIFFDPGGGATDQRDEFIEIRGVPNTSLDDHYLIFLENELDEFGFGDAGVIENIFDLGTASLGDNGFLVLLQKFNRYSSEQRIDGATFLTNDGPNKPGAFPGAFPGFGNNAEGGEGSTIGASDLPSVGGTVSTGALENSGFTAMLIRNDSGGGPMLGDDLDVGNDGLDVPTGQSGWTILDSVGVFGEADETEFGRLYGRSNFGSGDVGFFAPGWTPNVEPGADFAIFPYEIEHIARWGNSTGTTADDWHLTNLTDNGGSGSSGVNGSSGPLDLRQSGDHPSDDGNPNTPAPQPSVIETNQGVPYGTKLLASIGGPNYLTGDFNKNGVIDAADYTVWRDTVGVLGSETAHPAADANHDFRVDEADYAAWVAAFNGGASPSSVALPEPGGCVIAGLVATGVALTRRRRFPASH